MVENQIPTGWQVELVELNRAIVLINWAKLPTERKQRLHLINPEVYPRE